MHELHQLGGCLCAVNAFMVLKWVLNEHVWWKTSLAMEFHFLLHLQRYWSILTQLINGNWIYFFWNDKLFLALNPKIVHTIYLYELWTVFWWFKMYSKDLVYRCVILCSLLPPASLPVWWPDPWRHHQMRIFSVLLAICAGNSPVTGEFPSQRPVTPSFDVFFDLSLNYHLRLVIWDAIVLIMMSL